MSTSDSTFYGLLILANGRKKTPEVLPEVHLNLWEKKKKWIFDSAFLDIGLMLDVEDSAQSLEIVLPWQISQSDIEDLSPRLQEKGAIPAIFNEGWACSMSNGRSGCITEPITKTPIFTFVELLIGTDLKVNTIHPGTDHAQKSISLNIPNAQKKSKSSYPDAKRMYVRFRVKNVPEHFYRVTINPRDRLFLSSWQRTEIIDFRMNVRRGVPPGFEQRFDAAFIEFSKVHLFLMKNRDQDIVFEDKLFKSCRSLEDEHFWASYSLGVSPNDWQKFWSRRQVKNSLGYQWTKTIAKDPITGKEVAVTEFGALARFKNVQFGLVKFVIVAGLVGALGSMVWDVVKYRYDGSPIATRVQVWLVRSPHVEGSK